MSTANIKLKGYTSRKLQPRWIGPYLITDAYGTSFRLQLPVNMKGIHPTFHASLLQPYHGKPPQAPPPMEIDGYKEFEVDQILNHRSHRGRTQYLVKWKGYNDEDNTWQDVEDLENAAEILAEYK